MFGRDDGMSAAMLLLVVGAVLLGAVWLAVGLLAILWLLRQVRSPGAAP